jgi:hypothetical protein
MHVPAEQKAPIGPRDTAKNLKQTTAAPPDFSLIGKADEEKRVLRDSAKQSASGPRDGKKAQPTTPAPRSIPHQRQGDRGADDGADNAKLPVYCRYRDLVKAGIAMNWPQLLRMVTDQGFPTGIMLSANIRVWEVDQIQQWLAARPTAPKVVNVQKAKETRRLAALGAASKKT